jgi:hypothetical protein
MVGKWNERGCMKSPELVVKDLVGFCNATVAVGRFYPDTWNRSSFLSLMSFQQGASYGLPALVASSHYFPFTSFVWPLFFESSKRMEFRHAVTFAL